MWDKPAPNFSSYPKLTMYNIAKAYCFSIAQGTIKVRERNSTRELIDTIQKCLSEDHSNQIVREEIFTKFFFKKISRKPHVHAIRRKSIFFFLEKGMPLKLKNFVGVVYYAIPSKIKQKFVFNFFSNERILIFNIKLSRR